MDYVKSITKYGLLRMCFSRILATDKGTNFVQILCLTKQPFLSKTTTGCLQKFSFLEVSRRFLILRARIQSLKESQVVAIESFSIKLTEAIVRKCPKKRCFRNIGGTNKKAPISKYNFR